MILYVDDSQAQRRLFERLLTRKGCQAQGADQYEADGLDWQQFDLVALDVMMPELDADALIARQVARHGPAVLERVVLVSAIPPRRLAEVADKLKVAWLSKTEWPNELAEKLVERANHCS